jgi:hypothetical protein
VQTFLPYPGFAESAAVLDDRRLGKQRVETFQVLRALVWPKYGWKNHPAVAMWRGCVPALVSYGVAVCDEWVLRGRADATRAQLLEFSGGRAATWRELRDAGELPPWIGREDVHRSHQSSLLRKEPERYRAVFPEVPDDLDYVWPGSVFPRWPVRRGPRAIDVDEAARRAGRPDGATERDFEVVGDLRDDAAAAVTLPADADGRLTALIASLALPGRAVWLQPGAAPEPGPPAGERDPVTGSGSTSASIARAPSPDDVAAMSAEAAARPDLLWLREGQARRTPPEGTGLLVLTDGARPPRGWKLPTISLVEGAGVRSSAAAASR